MTLALNAIISGGTALFWWLKVDLHLRADWRHLIHPV